mmetsp:Transcript_2420/g.6506  ORF Transcript_2420/g.6506 Transcript_2420/m.6506 type:complete len:256 (-) Transcript_2420:3-770(-)
MLLVVAVGDGAEDVPDDPRRTVLGEALALPGFFDDPIVELPAGAQFRYEVDVVFVLVDVVELDDVRMIDVREDVDFSLELRRVRELRLVDRLERTKIRRHLVPALPDRPEASLSENVVQQLVLLVDVRREAPTEDAVVVVVVVVSPRIGGYRAVLRRCRDAFGVARCRPAGPRTPRTDPMPRWGSGTTSGKGSPTAGPTTGSRSPVAHSRMRVGCRSPMARRRRRRHSREQRTVCPWQKFSRERKRGLPMQQQME